VKEFYESTNFRQESLDLIDRIDVIVRSFVAQGFRLTVRQLYYQLVAKAIIPNTERSYKNTVRLVNEARLAGLLDWEAIEDRTRGFTDRPHWKSGKEILTSSAKQFHMDMWENQGRRVFVIVEKEALSGVLEGICYQYDVPLLSARGYPSASVLREFAKGTLSKTEKDIVLLHLGDHDPSGIDMTRDLRERLRLLSCDAPFELRRIALTMEQIEAQRPPPNPAKTTDSRFEDYEEQFGTESWELDALQPAFLVELVEGNIIGEIDQDNWEEREAEIKAIRTKLEKVAKEFKD
jgi:hypothetical protein